VWLKPGRALLREAGVRRFNHPPHPNQFSELSRQRSLTAGAAPRALLSIGPAGLRHVRTPAAPCRRALRSNLHNPHRAEYFCRQVCRDAIAKRRPCHRPRPTKATTPEPISPLLSVRPGAREILAADAFRRPARSVHTGHSTIPPAGAPATPPMASFAWQIGEFLLQRGAAPPSGQ